MADNILEPAEEVRAKAPSAPKRLGEQIVFLRRKNHFIKDANPEPEVQEYFDMAYRAVGSWYKEVGRAPGTGMTLREEKMVLPLILDVDPDVDGRDYKKESRRFYTEINTKVPPKGLRLNIGLEYEGELSEDNPPQKPGQYAVYKHALGHPEVGATKEEAMKYDHMKFYVDDEEAIHSLASSLNKIEDEALIEYYAIKEDVNRTEQVLSVLGVDSSKMSVSEREIKLKELASKDSRTNAAGNQQRLERFIELSKDKNLEYKYTITEMIRVGVLERVNMQVLIKETGDVVGRDMKEAVVWFKDPTNSRELNVLTARYNEFKKR